MKRPALLMLALVVGCTTASSTPNDDAEKPTPAAPRADASVGKTEPTPTSDAGGSPEASTPDAGYPLTYRNSISVCWTDAKCNRALTVAHGGDWSYTGDPYLSNAALTAAVDHGADGIKIDGRITKDGIVVLAHSSPIEAFESLDCTNKKIEEMTAAEVTACHRFPSQSETFQRLDTVLDKLRGKAVVQICVKRKEDTAGITAAVLASHAEDFAFLEIETADLQTIVPTVPNGDKVWYLVQVNDVAEVDTLLTLKNPRAFMYEFEPEVAVGPIVTNRLHPAGIRSFTYVKNVFATNDVKQLFDKGFDVVSTNSVGKGVDARVQVNTARSVSPP